MKSVELRARFGFPTEEEPEVLQPAARDSGGVVPWVRSAGVWGCLLGLLAVGLRAEEPPAAPVVVSLRADSTTLEPGQSTVVRAFAQVAPGFRARVERLFSWNLDVLVVAPEVGVLDAATLVRPRADPDPVLNSNGVADGFNLLGVRGSFLDFEGAGVAAPVELFSIGWKGLAAGECVIRVRPGTLGADASPDFLVLPLGDEEPWSGGDYAEGRILLRVGGGTVGDAPSVRVERVGATGVRVRVEGSVGSTVALEESDAVAGVPNWRRVGQGTAGSGIFQFEATPTSTVRFYRGVRL